MGYDVHPLPAKAASPALHAFLTAVSRRGRAQQGTKRGCGHSASLSKARVKKQKRTQTEPFKSQTLLYQLPHTYKTKGLLLAQGNGADIHTLGARPSHPSSNESLSLQRLLRQKWPSPLRLCGQLTKPAGFTARGRTATLPDPPSIIRYGPGPDSAASPGTQLSACLNSSTFSSALVNWKYIKHRLIEVKHVLKHFAELRRRAGQRLRAREGCSPAELRPGRWQSPGRRRGGSAGTAPTEVSFGPPFSAGGRGCVSEGITNGRLTLFCYQCAVIRFNGCFTRCGGAAERQPLPGQPPAGCGRAAAPSRSLTPAKAVTEVPALWFCHYSRAFFRELLF